MTAAELISHLAALCGEDRFEIRITYRRFSPRSKRRAETVFQVALGVEPFKPECPSPLELLDQVRATVDARGALAPRAEPRSWTQSTELRPPRDELIPIVIGASPHAAAAAHRADHVERICQVCCVWPVVRFRVGAHGLEQVCIQCPWPTHDDETTTRRAVGED